MKIARLLLKTAALVAIFIATPACEMQKAENTVKGYGEKHDAETAAGEHPEPTNETPPTYFKE